MFWVKFHKVKQKSSDINMREASKYCISRIRFLCILFIYAFEGLTENLSNGDLVTRQSRFMYCRLTFYHWRKKRTKGSAGRNEKSKKERRREEKDKERRKGGTFFRFLCKLHIGLCSQLHSISAVNYNVAILIIM